MREASLSLAMRIAQALDDAGIRPGDVARRLGVVPSTVSGWLRGRREPDAATLTQIAEMCGVTTDELLGRALMPMRREPPAEPPLETRDDLTHALEKVRSGDWEALARTLAEALILRERTEQQRVHLEEVRLREVEAVRAQADLTAQRNVEAAMAEARARTAPAKRESAPSGAHVATDEELLEVALKVPPARVRDPVPQE